MFAWEISRSLSSSAWRINLNLSLPLSPYVYTQTHTHRYVYICILCVYVHICMYAYVYFKKLFCSYSFFLSKGLMTQKKASLLHWGSGTKSDRYQKKIKDCSVCLFVFFFVSKLKFKFCKNSYAVPLPSQLYINWCHFIQHSYIIIFAVKITRKKKVEIDVG